MSQRRQIHAMLAGACTFSVLGICSAPATALTPALVAGQVQFSNPPIGLQVTTFGTFPLSGATGSLQFTASGTPAPFLAADAVMVPFFFGRASGTLLYEMEILGPAGQVPVSITASGAVAGESDVLGGDVFASFAMKSVWSLETTSGVPIISEEGISTPALTGAFSQSYGKTHDLMLTANQVYRVRMTADAGARGASATAFIDPIFSFGPGIGPEYSFEFSAGVGNVPELSSLAQFGAGLAFIGLCYRRSRRSSSAARSAATAWPRSSTAIA